MTEQVNEKRQRSESTYATPNELLAYSDLPPSSKRLRSPMREHCPENVPHHAAGSLDADTTDIRDTMTMALGTQEWTDVLENMIEDRTDGISVAAPPANVSFQILVVGIWTTSYRTRIREYHQQATVTTLEPAFGFSTAEMAEKFDFIILKDVEFWASSATEATRWACEYLKPDGALEVHGCQSIIICPEQSDLNIDQLLGTQHLFNTRGTSKQENWEAALCERLATSNPKIYQRMFSVRVQYGPYGWIAQDNTAKLCREQLQQRKVILNGHRSDGEDQDVNEEWVVDADVSYFVCAISPHGCSAELLRRMITFIPRPNGNLQVEIRDSNLLERIRQELARLGSPIEESPFMDGSMLFLWLNRQESNHEVQELLSAIKYFYCFYLKSISNPRPYLAQRPFLWEFHPVETLDVEAKVYITAQGRPAEGNFSSEEDWNSYCIVAWQVKKDRCILKRTDTGVLIRIVTDLPMLFQDVIRLPE